jgi:RNA polymerase-binding protein DksA
MKRRFTKKELDIYKEKLLNLKDDIITQIKEISEDTLMKTQKDLSGDISSYTLHMADVATDNYERDFNLGLVSGERETLLEIDDALKRIEEKKYGICSMCQRPIGKKRLDAIPYAKYCRRCKEKMENER